MHTSLLHQGYVAIPLKEGTSGYLFVEISFGNNDHYPLMLDTGSCYNKLDPTIIIKFHFKKTGKAKKGSGGGGYSGLEYEVTVPEFQLDNYAIHNETAYVANHSFSFENVKLNKKYNAGFLGIDFLRKHSAIIDIKNQYLYIKTAQKNTELLKMSVNYQEILMNSGYKLVRLDQSPRCHLIILNAAINNFKPGQFLLDSGSILLLSLDYVKRQSLPLTGPIAISKGVDGGNMKIFKTSIDNISVGPVSWNPDFVIATNFKYITRGVGTPLVGVIGIDWMKAHRAIIDVANNKIYLQPISIASKDRLH